MVAPANSSSSSVTGVPLLALQAGGRDPPDWMSYSLTFQELVQLREALNGEAAGQRAAAAGAWTLWDLQEYTDKNERLGFGALSYDYTYECRRVLMSVPKDDQIC